MNSAWRVTGFGVSIYLLVGANLPYLPVWLEQARGFSGAEISAIVAAGTLLRIFIGPLVAARAEQTSLALVLGQTSFVCLFAFSAAAPDAVPFIGVMVLIAVTYVAWGLLMPLTDAVLLAGTRGQVPDYGVARALASVSFIVASLSVGALVSVYGPDAAIWWLVGASALMVLSSLTLPKEVEPIGARQPLSQTLREGFWLYRKRSLFLATFGASMIQAAHAYYYNLGSNIWVAQGIGENYIGALWSTGVAVEVVFLLASGVLFARWRPAWLIIMGGCGATLRWLLMGLAPPLEVLFVLQTLHAFSFAATHIGILWFLKETLAEDKVPVALSINSAVLFGPMLSVFGLITGAWYDHYPNAQAQGYWLMAGMTCLGVICVLGGMRTTQPQSTRLGGETKPSL